MTAPNPITAAKHCAVNAWIDALERADAEQSAEAQAIADRLRVEIERPAGIGERPVQGSLL